MGSDPKMPTTPRMTTGRLVRVKDSKLYLFYFIFLFSFYFPFIFIFWT